MPENDWGPVIKQLVFDQRAQQLALIQLLNDYFALKRDPQTAHREFTDRLHAWIDSFPKDSPHEQGIGEVQSAVDRLMRMVEALAEGTKDV